MNSTNWSLARVAVVAALLTSSTVAEAHSPIKGLATFYSYFLHPIVVPSHAMFLIATALMLGQQGRSSARIGVATLGVAFAAALMAASAGVVDGLQAEMLLFGALVVGGVVSLDRQMTTPLTALAAAVAGIAVGLDSAMNSSGGQESLLAFAGIAFGVLYLVVLITGTTVGFTKHWHRIGVRIVGSWIVAASVLVLTLSIAGPTKRLNVGFLPVLEHIVPC
jgi:hypothetical protein